MGGPEPSAPTPRDRADRLASADVPDDFTRDGVRVRLASRRVLDDGTLEVRLRSARDGARALPVDERYLFVNPPTRVPIGTRHVEENHPSGQLIEVDDFEENPGAALRAILVDAVRHYAERGRAGNVTLTIFASASDGYVLSDGLIYADVRGAGTSLGVNDFSTTRTNVGQQFSVGTSYVYESYLDFITDAVPDFSQIDSATLSLWGQIDGSVTNFVAEVRAFDFGATLDTGDWVNGDNLGDHPLVATWDTAAASFASAYNAFTENGTAFRAAINRTGSTRLVISSSRQRLANAPAGDEYLQYRATEQTGTTNDPKLVVNYTEVEPYLEKITSKENAGDVTQYTSDPFPTVAGGVYLLALAAATGAGAGPDLASVVIDPNVGADDLLTLLGSATEGSGANVVTLYLLCIKADVTESAGATKPRLIIDWNNVQARIAYALYRFHGPAEVGTNGELAFRNVVGDFEAAAASLTIDLAAFWSSVNPTFGAFATPSDAGVDIVPGAGFEELDDFRVTGEALRLMTEWKQSADQTVDASQNSGRWVGVALELIRVALKSAADTAAGADASTLSAAITSSDAAVGSDAAQRVDVFSSDAATGGEAATVDTGAVAKTASDAAVGSDASAVGITRSDAAVGADASVVNIYSSDAATGAESSRVGVTRSDAATGGDAVASVGVARSDAATGSELASLATAHARTDAATGADAVQRVGVERSDAAVGSDAATLAVAHQRSDAATGSEASAVGITRSDAATGSDASSLAVAHARADAAAGADASVVGVAGSDTAASADASTLAVAHSRTDAAAGAEASSVGLVSSDAATGSEASLVSVPIVASDAAAGDDASTVGVARSDSATGADQSSIAAAVGATDAASAGEGTPAIGAFGSDAATGADSAPVAQALVSSDAATGGDAAQRVDVSATPDTAAGGDASASAAALGAADAAVGAEAAEVGVAGSDLAAGAEVGVLDVAIVRADSATGSDELQRVTILTADTAIGGDAGTAEAGQVDKFASDSATGGDAAQLVGVSGVADTSTGADAGVPGASIAAVDAATGQQAVSLIAVVPPADSSSGGEAAVVAAVVSTADVATGAELASLVAAIVSVDTATGGDVGMLPAPHIPSPTDALDRLDGTSVVDGIATRVRDVATTGTRVKAGSRTRVTLAPSRTDAEDQ